MIQRYVIRALFALICMLAPVHHTWTSVPLPMSPVAPVPVQTSVAQQKSGSVGQQSTPMTAVSLPLPSAPAAPVPMQPHTNASMSSPAWQVAPSAAAAVDAGQIAAPDDAAQTSATEANIFLNFENADLRHFIDYIAGLKKLNLILDKGVEGSKISLSIRQGLTLDAAWNVFLTVLEMAGFSIIEKGDVYTVVPRDKKVMQPLPAYINVPVSTLPDSDLTIRYVIILSNLHVKDVKGLLDSMLGQNSASIAQEELNAFIITDKSYNIKAAVKLIQDLDQMGLPEEVAVLRLNKVNATDLKELLDTLIRSKSETNPLARLLGKVSEGSTEYFSPTTRIIAEERSNSLILLGRSASIQKIIDFVKNSIEKEDVTAKSPLHFYELQNIDAEQLVTILQDVTKAPDSQTGQAAAKYGSVRGGVKYFKGMTFKVDKNGNRLIVSAADRQDWKLLKKTIQDLDKPSPQVAIQTLIVSVDVTDNKQLGGQIRNKKEGQIGRHIDFQSAPPTSASPALLPKASNGTGSADVVSLLGNVLNNFATQQGAAILSFGKGANIWAVLQSLQSQQTTSIISQPFVTVANKTEATVDVGSERRVVQEDQGSSGGLQGFVTVKASTKLVLTPQINLDGIISMKVDVNLGDFQGTSGGDTTTREVKTNITVADGGLIVLGGFVKTKVSENKQKTWLLGDIPILGWLAKSQSRTITKEYIFIFIAPTIVKPRQQPGMNMYTRMKMHQATDDIEEAVQTKRVMDPIHNWFFNPDNEQYSHKVIDFANARYQPTTVDIARDPFYRSAHEPELQDFSSEQQATVHAKEALQTGDAMRAKLPIEQPAVGMPKLDLPVQPLPIVPVMESRQVPPPSIEQTVIKQNPTTVKPLPLPQVPSQPPSLPPLPTMAPVAQQTAAQAPPQALPMLPLPPSPAPAPSGWQDSVLLAPRKRSSVQELDQDIAAKREQLKQLFGNITPMARNQQNSVPQQASVDEQSEPIAQNLKDFIGAPATTSVQDQPAEKQRTTGFDGRNRLKNFLARAPGSMASEGSR